MYLEEFRFVLMCMQYLGYSESIYCRCMTMTTKVVRVCKMWILNRCLQGWKNWSVLHLMGICQLAGVYADADEVRKVLSEKYGKLSVSELKESKEFKEDFMGGDIGMTVRLQIVYSKLSIRSVRSAFEESVGSRLQNFGEPNSKELLQR